MAAQDMPLRNGTVVGQFVLHKQHWPIFEQGVTLVFNKWMALRLAVENQWGGRNSQEKADELIDDVLEWFTTKREHYPDQLEELLDDTLSVDFNVDAEDDSPREIAETLVAMYKECLHGDFSRIHRMEAQAAPPTAASNAAANTLGIQENGDDSSGSSSGDDDSDSEAEGMDIDEPNTPAPNLVPVKPKQPHIDEDGFQLVERRGRN